MLLAQFYPLHHQGFEMPKAVLTGRLRYKIRSIATFCKILTKVVVRRMLGKPIVPEWTPIFEHSTLFWRAQFNHAFELGNIGESRAYFDSFYFAPDHEPAVDIHPSKGLEPPGDWFIPHQPKTDMTMLYFHGGGYSFYAAVSRLFIAMLAEKLGMVIFAPNYRLPPEHPHPAQIDDGLAAYRFLCKEGIDPRKLVVCGDSAGGHLVLMLLVKLRDAGLVQPRMGIALSPWTDIGRRGASQFGNDPYDMVQGYMTLQFANWLKGTSAYSDAELSPIHQDLRGLAPIYLQAGGKEILVDMIRDFAKEVEAQAGEVRLDVWKHMNHEFHAYGDDLPESAEALRRIGEAIAWRVEPGKDASFPASVVTEVDSLLKSKKASICSRENGSFLSESV